MFAMSTFGRLLKTYRERAGLSQGQLSIHAGLSASTISRVEKGERGPLRKRSQVMALAKALGLKQGDDRASPLLSAADLAPSTAPELSLHPRDDTLYRIAQEGDDRASPLLRTDTQVTPAQIRFVEEILLLVLRGARAALTVEGDDRASPLLGEHVRSVVPSTSTFSARTLNEEERYLDDLLGDFIAGKPNGGPMPFTVLSAAARSPHWELKRRLAEALPALLARTECGGDHGGSPLRLDAERTLSLIKTLRRDPPDREWRTDIRRRVIEAMPALWQVMPKEGDDRASPLLARGGRGIRSTGDARCAVRHRRHGAGRRDTTKRPGSCRRRKASPRRRKASPRRRKASPSGDVICRGVESVHHRSRCGDPDHRQSPRRRRTAAPHLHPRRSG